MRSKNLYIWQIVSLNNWLTVNIFILTKYVKSLWQVIRCKSVTRVSLNCGFNLCRMFVINFIIFSTFFLLLLPLWNNCAVPAHLFIVALECSFSNSPQAAKTDCKLVNWIEWYCTINIFRNKLSLLIIFSFKIIILLTLFFRYDFVFFISCFFFFVRRIHKLSKSDCWASSCLSVRSTVRLSVSVCPSAWNNSALTRRIFMKFSIWGFFEVCWENWSLMKIWEQRVIHMKIHVYVLYHFAELFLEREAFHTKALHKIKTFMLLTLFYGNHAAD